MTFRQLLAGCGLSGPIRAPTIWRRPRLADFLRETADRLCQDDRMASEGGARHCQLKRKRPAITTVRGFGREHF